MKSKRPIKKKYQKKMLAFAMAFWATSIVNWALGQCWYCQTAPISGPTVVCVGNTATFTVDAENLCDDPNAVYDFSISDASNHLLASTNTFTLTYKFSTPGNYTVNYTSDDMYTCGFVGTLHVSVPSMSVPVTSILKCDNSTFTMSATGADSYTWSPSTGLNATTGSTVTGSLTSSQTYTVTGSFNSGCPSVSKSVTVTVGVPNAVTITGPTNLCVNSPNFTYSFVGNNTPTTSTVYTWSIPNSGLGTLVGTYSGYGVTTATVDYNNSATGGYYLNVVASNACGTGPTASAFINISGSAPSTPSTIFGPSSACNNGSISSYSLGQMTAGVEYEITPVSPVNAVASSTTSVYGQINVDWNNSFTGTAYIRARVNNGCGVSGWSASKPVSIVNGTCRLGAVEDENSSNALSVDLYPNPGKEANLVINETNSEKATIEIVNMAGETVFKNEDVTTGNMFVFGSNLAAGIYTVKVFAGEKQKIMKFVKQ